MDYSGVAGDMKPNKEQLEALKLNRDYRLVYCKKGRRNYLTLGYFGGGVLNVKQISDFAKKFADASGLTFETIHVDEINKSRRMAKFKYIYSTQSNQEPLPTAKEVDNFWRYAR